MGGEGYSSLDEYTTRMHTDQKEREEGMGIIEKEKVLKILGRRKTGWEGKGAEQRAF